MRNGFSLSESTFELVPLALRKVRVWHGSKKGMKAVKLKERRRIVTGVVNGNVVGAGKSKKYYIINTCSRLHWKRKPLSTCLQTILLKESSSEISVFFPLFPIPIIVFFISRILLISLAIIFFHLEEIRANVLTHFNFNGFLFQNFSSRKFGIKPKLFFVKILR